MSAADPFYLVKEDIDDLVVKLEDKFGIWEHQSTGEAERAKLKKELLTSIDGIEWQVNELDKAITVAERDPSRFGIQPTEIERRRQWSNSRHEKIKSLRQFLQQGRKPGSNNFNAVRRELMRMQGDGPGPKPNRGLMEANDDFLVGESERQALMLKEQDEDLDVLSESVGRLGHFGITIHEELNNQEKILSDLDRDMDATMNRLDFVQKRVAHVLKKAGLKGRICLIISLVVLLLMLTFMVFFT